jgi:eukaryotic-like serine/threonine-protein kinase
MMAAQQRRKTPPFRTVVQPQPQTLTTTAEPPRRRAGFPPRFTFEPGARIGSDFTVIGHLSAGSISELYQVWSASHLCALTCKILLPKFASQSKEARGLKREATLLRRMAHPNIVHIFGQGTHEDRQFLIQEYLHGPSLLELIDSSPNRQVHTPDAIKAIVHVCAALVHLHELGYIHRDIKPANVILRGGIPVLVDFDVAYRLQPGHKPRERMGTDPYMAPEQCVKEELSPATDIYGVGAVLYEMLTGRWPFEEELMNHPEHQTLEDRYPQIRGSSPPSPGEFNAQISPGLQAILVKCLLCNPSQRFQSARELAKALAHFLEGKDQLWPESLDLKDAMVCGEIGSKASEASTPAPRGKRPRTTLKSFEWDNRERVRPSPME